MRGEILDTHVVIRFLGQPQRLGKLQLRALREAERRGEQFQISAITLIEVAQMFRTGSVRMPMDPRAVLHTLESEDRFRVLPITVAIARDFGTMFPILRDPADAIIAATARVHGLRLVTSDQRIIDSNVVSTIA